MTPAELPCKNAHYPKDPSKGLRSHPGLKLTFCQVHLKHFLVMNSLAQNFWGTSLQQALDKIFIHEPGGRVFLPSPTLSFERSPHLDPLVPGNQVKSGALVFSQNLQAQSLCSQDFLLISGDHSPLPPPLPISSRNPMPSRWPYLSRGPERARPDLSPDHTACAVYYLLFMFTRSGTFFKIHKFSTVGHFFFLQNYEFLLNILGHVGIQHNSQLQECCKYFQSHWVPGTKAQWGDGRGLLSSWTFHFQV